MGSVYESHCTTVLKEIILSLPLIQVGHLFVSFEITHVSPYSIVHRI